MARWLVKYSFEILLILFLFFLFLNVVHARDFGQWDRSTERSAWFRWLMQPDNPSVSCCGEGDGYECDDIGVETKLGSDGEKHVVNFCLITDERDDAPLHRPHVDIGTRIDIPTHKMKFSDSDPQRTDTSMPRNPTGHSMVFLSTGRFVYCFVLSGGV